MVLIRAARAVSKPVEDILQAYVNLPGGAGAISEDYLLKHCGVECQPQKLNNCA